MADTALTVEKKAELFDKIIEQRKDVIHWLYDIIEEIHTLECNDYGLQKDECEKLTSKDNTHYQIFKRRFNETIANLKGLKRPELEAAGVADWPLERADYYKGYHPPKMNKSKRWLVQQMLRFFIDFDLDKSTYPSADIGVYQEFAQSLVYIALDSIGVGHDDKDILEFLNEIIDDNGDVKDGSEALIETWRNDPKILLNELIFTIHDLSKAGLNLTNDSVKELSQKIIDIEKRAREKGLVSDSRITKAE